MKKIILLVITLISLSALLKAQNSFPTSNAIWNECTQINDAKYEVRCGLLGDTMINNILYSKLYVLSDTLLFDMYIYNYVGALRNEDQKVFFKPAYWGYYDFNTETWQDYPDILLYDFGAEVGDTVWHNAIIYDYYNIIPHDESYSVITSIRMENNRKIYSVNSPGPTFVNQWIEGIGSYDGVLRSIETARPLDGNSYSYYLLCFKHNDIVEYLSNFICNKCFCSTVDIKENFYSELINIYPNPAKDILNIKTSDAAKYKTATIYDGSGRELKRFILTSDITSVNISDLSNGLYIVKLLSAEKEEISLSFEKISR